MADGRVRRVRQLEAVLVTVVCLVASVAFTDRGTAAASARLAVTATEALSTPKTVSNRRSSVVVRPQRASLRRGHRSERLMAAHRGRARA